VSNQHYTKSRLELRYYYTPLNKTINSFVAFEGFYVPYNYVQKDGAYHGIDGSAYIFDVAHVKRDIKGFDVKIGCVLKFKFPLLVEGFVGLGFRNVNLVYSDFTNRKLDTSQHRIAFATPPSQGEQTKLHVALGIKIGYRIF